MGNQNDNEPKFVIKTKQYIRIIEHITKKIEKFKPKDRLNYAISTAFLLNALKSSIGGWKQWMDSLENIGTMTMKDWEEIYPQMVKISTNWLKLDIQITKKKIVEAAVKLKESKNKLKKGKKTTTTYVA